MHNSYQVAFVRQTFVSVTFIYQFNIGTKMLVLSMHYNNSFKDGQPDIV